MATTAEEKCHPFPSHHNCSSSCEAGVGLYGYLLYLWRNIKGPSLCPSATVEGDIYLYVRLRAALICEYKHKYLEGSLTMWIYPDNSSRFPLWPIAFLVIGFGLAYSVKCVFLKSLNSLNSLNLSLVTLQIAMPLLPRRSVLSSTAFTQPDTTTDGCSPPAAWTAPSDTAVTQPHSSEA